MFQFSTRIAPFVQAELTAAHSAENRGDAAVAFAHLERAHVLGQASTVHHVRAHWHMLIWGLRHKDTWQTIGQLWRVVGAATKTAFGLVPSGNTGGANVSGFRRMPIDADLQVKIEAARR